ncbi:uncharacterized protein LOC128133493 [Lactuca sativa]|uniref:uncharacterized protein LOC128133493 n=1 Tax=Lactuca sativa TaxID=4236 RepID=UPI0022AF2E1E|nr:uncharacterized protein LOC128133493 [Lactuca sativa]
MKLFADVLVVLDFVKEEGGSLANHQQSSGILAYFKSYEFVFYLHMMYDILHLTGTLSKQLQRKDLDILEAASMVRGTMEALQSFRNIGFTSILPKVFSFCQTHEIETLDMEELYIGERNRRTTKTNRFHFEVEIFNTVVDMQLTEYRDWFSETRTQLLEYMGALSPCDSFAQFDKSKLLKLGKLYKYDFDDSDMIDLEGQLEIFYHSCIKDERFTSLKGISDLSRLMVSTGKNRSYPLVYKLLKLALILPVATASVERCFSKLKLLKTDLRNKIGDEFLNDALLCNVETKALTKVEDEKMNGMEMINASLELNDFDKVKGRLILASPRCSEMLVATWWRDGDLGGSSIVSRGQRTFLHDAVYGYHNMVIKVGCHGYWSPCHGTRETINLFHPPRFIKVFTMM